MVNIMASELNLNDVATLTSLQGKGFVRHADGTRSELVAGMKLGLGDVVITMPSSKASVQLADGRHFDLARSQGDAIKIDQTVLDVLSDIQDVSVTDLSVIYPLVASQVMTDPTIDPLSFVNDEHSNDLSQTTVMDEREEPAALNDAEGGDLLSGNSYVVLHGNPPVTDATPFVTEPAHFNHDFMPEAIPAFVPNASPLAHLIAEHTPVVPAAEQVTPSGVTPLVEPPPVEPPPIIRLMLDSTTYKDIEGHDLINSQGSTPIVDDESGGLWYRVESQFNDVAQNFNVYVTYGDQQEQLLQSDWVSPLGYEQSGYENKFFVPILDDALGQNQTVHVRLEPVNPSIEYGQKGLDAAFIVGELGSETEATPASLHVVISAPIIDPTEASDRELTAVYKVQLTDGSSVIQNEQAVQIHWILQNSFTPGLFVEGDKTINPLDGSVEISVAVPEEDPKDASNLENYTLTILLDDNVVVTSGSQLYTINPVVIPEANVLYSNLQDTTHPHQFVVAQTPLQFENDHSFEGLEQSASAAFDTDLSSLLPGTLLALDDDHVANNPLIHFSIHSDQLQNLLQNGGLHFIVNVYDVNLVDPSETFIGTIADLDALNHVSGNQADFYVPVDLSQFENLAVPVDLHGKTLSFRLEADNSSSNLADINAVSLFTTVDPTPAFVQATVTDDSSYEQASIKDFGVDGINIVDGASGLFTPNQVVDALLSTGDKTVYDEFVKFTVNFEGQFGNAGFDVKLGDLTVGHIDLGINLMIPVYDMNAPIYDADLNLVGPIIGYTSGYLSDFTYVEYVLNTDGIHSSASFYVALPNTENNPTYSVTLVSVGPVYDLSGTNAFESVDNSPLQVSSAQYTIVPDVHVSATFDNVVAGQVDDEAIHFTILLDQKLSVDTTYDVKIETIDPNDSTGLTKITVYEHTFVVYANLDQQSFTIDQTMAPTLEALVGQDLSITLSYVDLGTVVSFYNGTDPVMVNVVNDPAYKNYSNTLTATVAELVSEPTITVSAPVTIDDENPNLVDPLFTYHVTGEAGPTPGIAYFDVYTQALGAGDVPVGDKQLVLTGQPIDLAVDGSFTVPLSAFLDGHQELILVPQDAELIQVTSSAFDVVDSSYQLVHNVIGDIDTFALLDVSDNTSTPVGGGEGGLGGGAEGGGNQGDPLTLHDLITPDSGSSIHLDFGDNAEHPARVADNTDFGNRELEDSPITEVRFDGNSGVVSFWDDEHHKPVTITPNNVDQAIEFLAQNSRHHEGATVQFNVVNDTQTDTYVFHQTADGYSVANITNIESVAGVDPQLLSPTTIHIDHS